MVPNKVKLIEDVTELFKKKMEGLEHIEGCMIHSLTNEASEESDADMGEVCSPYRGI